MVNSKNANPPAEDDNWEVVQEESPATVIFDTVGDTFVGQYLGEQHVSPSNEAFEEFDRYLFRGTDGSPYALNKSFSLATAMEKVQPGDWCRIRYVKDIPTNRKQNPMKDFEVAVRR